MAVRRWRRDIRHRNVVGRGRGIRGAAAFGGVLPVARGGDGAVRDGGAVGHGFGGGFVGVAGVGVGGGFLVEGDADGDDLLERVLLTDEGGGTVVGVEVEEVEERFWEEKFRY